MWAFGYYPVSRYRQWGCVWFGRQNSHRYPWQYIACTNCEGCLSHVNRRDLSCPPCLLLTRCASVWALSFYPPSVPEKKDSPNSTRVHHLNKSILHYLRNRPTEFLTPRFQWSAIRRPSVSTRMPHSEGHCMGGPPLFNVRIRNRRGVAKDEVFTWTGH